MRKEQQQQEDAALAPSKMAHEKMHHALQRTNNDTLGILDRGSDFLPRKLQKQNDFKRPSEVRGVSSLNWRNSDNRCSVLTFLKLESNGHWRIVALPLHCPDSKYLGSGASTDCLHFVCPQPINSVQADHQKVTKGPVRGGNYSSNSLTNKSFLGSTVQHQSQNKALANETKWSELPQKFCQKSLPGNESFGSMSKSSNDIKSSTAFVNNSEVDNVVKTSSKKKSKKSRRGRKKNPCQTGSTGSEVLSEESQRGGAGSGTYRCCDGDHKDSPALCSTRLESSLPEDVVHSSETPKTSASHSKGADMLEEALTETHAVGTLENQLLSKDSADSTCDGSRNTNHTKVSCYDDLHSRDSSNMPDSLTGLIHPDSVDSNKMCNISKQSEKTSCRADLSETVASNFSKGSLSCKSLSSNVVDKSSQGSLDRNSSDIHVSVPRNKQNNTFSRFSSASRFRSGGNTHGRPRKESSHSVWQKVQRNGTHDSIGDSKKVPVFSQCDATLEKGTCNTSKDEKQLKDNVSRKLGRKSGGALKQECKFNYKSGPPAGMVNAHGCVKVTTTCPDEKDRESVCITNSSMKKRAVDDSNHSLPKSCNSSGQSKVVQVQSPVFLPHIFGYSVKQRQESIPLSEGTQNCSSESLMQKWVPIRVKDLGLTNSANGSSLERFVNPSAENLTVKNTVESKLNVNSQDVPEGVTCVGKSSGYATHSSDDHACMTLELKNQDASVVEIKNKETAAHFSKTESGVLNTSRPVPAKIAEAVIDACRVQLASETVERVSGHPIAEFERLLHYSCPVINQLPNVVCHICSRNQFGGVLLCRHETPNISLGSVWQWYEEPSNYGLKTRAYDYGNTRRLGVEGFSFHAYFVPYLSAVQLFRNRGKNSEDENNKNSSSELSVSDGCTETSERSSSVDRLPIFSSLFPQPRKEFQSFPPRVNQVCSPEPSTASAKCVAASLGSVETTWSSDAELLFEYFETEPPQLRRPLYEKIEELVRGNGPSQYRGYGDPTVLDLIRLNDLHPKSWYSVAWYPIYRVPEGNFRAAFLTFHSLGHLMRRSARIDSQSVQNCIVCPVVGLQSYNAQSECWFQPHHSPTNQAKGAPDLNASGILTDRLRTLEETASLMARAVVNKENVTSVNRHPDYEFFCSRKCW